MKNKKQAFGYKMELVWSEEDKCYIAFCPELEGCKTHGATPSEALKNLMNVTELYLVTAKEEGIEVPEPASMKRFIGKILFRTKPSIHRRVAMLADIENKSVNEVLNELVEQGLRKAR